MTAFWLMVTVVSVAGMSFVAVLAWIAARTKERENQHRNDAVQKLIEAGDATPAIQYLRELEAAEHEKTRNGIRLGGLVTSAAGIGLMLFLKLLVRDEAIYAVGLIPLLIGIVLFVYGQFIMKKAD